jgi:hypothetical protein
VKNVLTIIDSFVHNEKVRRKLDDCLTKLQERNHDILLISNTIVDPNILKKVNFYLYDQRNQLFEDTYNNYSKTVLWRECGNFIVYDIVPGLQRHGLSVLINLFNAVHLASILGYEFFQRFEADDLMGPKSLDFVDTVPKLCLDSKSLGLFYFNERNNEKECDVSFHYFYCYCSYFLDKVEQIQNENDYRKFLLITKKNKDFMICERYIYENFKMNGSSKLLKRSGIDTMKTDFSDTIWNSETTPSNVASKYDGCVTKLYKKRVKDQPDDEMIVFSYNYLLAKKKRRIIVEHLDGTVDNILHDMTNDIQWTYSILVNVKKISVFEDNVFLYDEAVQDVESYINFFG